MLHRLGNVCSAGIRLLFCVCSGKLKEARTRQSASERYPWTPRLERLKQRRSTDPRYNYVAQDCIWNLDVEEMIRL